MQVSLVKQLPLQAQVVLVLEILVVSLVQVSLHRLPLLCLELPRPLFLVARPQVSILGHRQLSQRQVMCLDSNNSRVRLFLLGMLMVRSHRYNFLFVVAILNLSWYGSLATSASMKSLRPMLEYVLYLGRRPWVWENANARCRVCCNLKSSARIEFGCILDSTQLQAQSQITCQWSSRRDSYQIANNCLISFAVGFAS